MKKLTAAALAACISCVLACAMPFAYAQASQSASTSVEVVQVFGAIAHSEADDVSLGNAVMVWADVAGGTGPFSYSWRASTDGGQTWGDVLSTAGSFSFDPVEAGLGEPGMCKIACMIADNSVPAQTAVATLDIGIRAESRSESTTAAKAASSGSGVLPATGDAEQLAMAAAFACMVFSACAERYAYKRRHAMARKRIEHGKSYAALLSRMLMAVVLASLLMPSAAFCDEPDNEQAKASQEALPSTAENLSGSLAIKGALVPGEAITAVADGMQEGAEPVFVWGVVTQEAYEKLEADAAQGDSTKTPEAALEEELSMQLYLSRMESGQVLSDGEAAMLEQRFGEALPTLKNEQIESGARLLPDDICSSIVLADAELDSHVYAAAFDSSGTYAGFISTISEGAVCYPDSPDENDEAQAGPGASTPDATINAGVGSADATGVQNVEADAAEVKGMQPTATEALGIAAESPLALVALSSSAVYVSSSGADTNAGTLASPYKTLAKAYANVTGNGTIYLCSNLTLTSRMVFSGTKSVTITSYGSNMYTLYRGAALTGTEMLAKTGGGTLTLRNFNIDGQNVSAQGALWYQNGGTLDFQGSGTMSNAVSTYTAQWNDTSDAPFNMGGGAIASYSGTVNFRGWTIRNCTCNIGGGGIYIDKASTLNMISGTITGCNGVTYGGGVRVLSGTVNISGGSITGNTARLSGGGVSTGQKVDQTGFESTLSISGGEICNNTIQTGGAGGAGIMISGCNANVSSLHLSGNHDPDEHGEGIATTDQGLCLTGACYWISEDQEIYLRNNDTYILRRADNIYVNNDVSSLINNNKNVETFHDRVRIKPNTYAAGRLVMSDDRGVSSYSLSNVEALASNNPGSWGIASCAFNAYICTAITGSVTISGIAQYGNTLTASCASTNLISSARREYRWHRVHPDGSVESVSDATGVTSSYNLGQDDIGCYFVVDAFDGAASYSTSVRGPYITGKTATVTKKPATLSASISGSAAVGRSLTATAGNLPSQGTTQLAYQWSRSAAAGGPFEDIAGATAQSYAIAGQDEGYYLACTISGENPCYEIASARALTSGAVSRLALSGTVSISGTARYGNPENTLTTSVTGLPGDAVPAYTWLRDGVAISGATASTFIVSAADVGHEISCQVVDSAAIYAGSLSASAGVVEGPQINVSVPISAVASGGDAGIFSVPEYDVRNNTEVPVYLTHVSFALDRAAGIFSDYDALELSLAIDGGNAVNVEPDAAGIDPQAQILSGGAIECGWTIHAGEGNYLGYAIGSQHLGQVGYVFSLVRE